MIDHFTDSLLRAPMIASILMCITSSLLGVLIFLKKRSLLAETLSHAAYPGMALAILFSIFFSCENAFWVLFGAFLASLGGYFSIHFLEKKGNLKEDSALSFVLAGFFGMGVVIVSYIQYASASKWNMIYAYLYGKAATMTDIYIVIYGIIFFIVLFAIVFFFKEIKVFLFDRQFAISLKMNVHNVEVFFFILSALAVVIGMRSVGLVLISSMLIAPAIFARSFTDHLGIMFILSGFVGGFCAIIGNVGALALSNYYDISIPIGPLIVLSASFFALLSLFFAPKRGLFLRYMRMLRFQREILRENLLKMMWRSNQENFSFQQLASSLGVSKISLLFAVSVLFKQKGIERHNKKYILSPLGKAMGAKIVRLHRLWEVYLVDYLGINAKRVHKNAEEIEHIITADLEKALLELLDDPKHDPHNQPIPSFEEKYVF